MKRTAIALLVVAVSGFSASLHADTTKGITSAGSKGSVTSPKEASSTTPVPPAAAPSGAPAATAATSDQSLQNGVAAALKSEPKLGGVAISVAANNGEVVLSGTVKDQSQADRAMRLAKGVAGVKNVTSSLTVVAG